MQRKKQGQKITQGPRKYGELSEEEIQRRWRGLTPMFVKFLIICALAALGFFFLNRAWHPDQRTVDFLNVGFQITLAGTGLFAFLTLMALVFGRDNAKTK